MSMLCGPALSGRTKAGLVVSGEVEVKNRQMGPGGPRGQTLVELHGSGPLEGLGGPAAEGEPA